MRLDQTENIFSAVSVDANETTLRKLEGPHFLIFLFLRVKIFNFITQVEDTMKKPFRNGYLIFHVKSSLFSNRSLTLWKDVR